MENHKQKIKIRKGSAMSVVERYAFLMFLFLAMPVLAFSQTRTVRGTVTDTQGEAITGASVTVSGTQRGTLTNVDGSFSIDVSPNDKLTISFLGFLKQEISVGKQTELTITLAEDNTMLDEVVVVGYGTQTKATLTGSVATIGSKEITVTKNENVVNMLAGKLPGVRVTQVSSRPGAFESKFDIRGLGTPLIVIDGLPSDADTFQRMDASDIESVSVLKDGSAAVYGLRSANGVILVTTKRGSSSAKGFDIQYSMNFGWQDFLHVPDNVDAVQYMTLVNERTYATNWWNTMRGNTNPRFTDADMQPYLDGTRQTTDWMDAIFKKYSPQQQHNITMNGGNDKVNYFFNVGYLKQESALRSNSMNYNRWNFRSNIDVNITKSLKASVSLSGYMDDMLEPSIDIWTIYKNAFTQQPTVPLYANDNPEYLNYSTGQQYDRVLDGHPLANSNSKYVGENEYRNKKFTGQLSLSYEIPGVQGLTAKASYFYDFRDKDSRWYKKAYNLYTYEGKDANGKEIYNPSSLYNGTPSGNNSIQRMNEQWENKQLQLSLHYKRTFNKAHNVEALVLFEDRYGNGDNFYARRELALNSEYLFAGESTNQVGSMNSGSPWDNSSQGFVGKINYDFMGKYLLELAGRYDGSSNFPKGSRWGTFGSVSAGWRISEETFFKESFLSFVNNLKLKASYGATGDNSGANTYPSIYAAYEIRGNDLGWMYGPGVSPGLQATAIPNPKLSWYTAKMTNIGIEGELWNGLLGGSFEYYIRKRDGLLATKKDAIPGTVGATMPQENLESDRTFGYDILLTHRNKIGDVEYNVSANMFATRNRWDNKIIEPAGNSYDNWKNRRDNTNRYKDIWFTRKTLGQFQSFQDIYNYPINLGGGGGLRPGEYYYQDWNGDGVINDDDQQPLATYGLPLFNYGFSLGATYKGFDLNASFQGAARVYYKYGETYAMPLGWGDGGTNSKFWDRWHPEDPTKMYDPTSTWISGQFPVTTGAEYDGSGSTRIENASYLRLKTLEIGYTIPKRLVSKVGIQNCRVYVSGYNLLTFTGMKGMDPEHPGNEGGGADSDGVSTYKYPIGRTFNVGASIKF